MILRLIVAMAFLAAGCMSVTQARQRASAGHVGCAQSKIEIRDNEETSWTAVCNNAIYYCSIDTATTTELMLVGDEHTHQVSCTRADEKPAAVARRPPATAPKPHAARVAADQSSGPAEPKLDTAANTTATGDNVDPKAEP